MKRASMIFVATAFMAAAIQGQDIREITSKEAFEMVKKESTHMLDVRSIAEYVFIGHPDMAFSIPLNFWNEQEQSMEPNGQFIEYIKTRFKKSDTLIFICRSGNRSRRAAQMLLREGYTQLFNVTDGFEGGRDDTGHRTVNGWKNSGLPYTYRMDESLVYRFPKK